VLEKEKYRTNSAGNPQERPQWEEREREREKKKKDMQETIRKMRRKGHPDKML
jgi:hypothetical protein